MLFHNLKAFDLAKFTGLFRIDYLD